MTGAAGSREAQARLDALLARALTLEGPARQAFVDGLDGDDASQALALRALLALAEDEDALAAPEGSARWRALFDAAPPDGVPPLPGPIGPWRPLRRLGDGGMGTVWLVEREVGRGADGFRQTGALKLLRPGADSDGFLRRFAEERRILASLHHPGIARLLDGGRAEDGRPWLVMEYVEGAPIDRACDQRRLDVPARVALFRRVAEAVATAHRNLIAHRDLKPGNILVGDDGAPRLLDFGIAKALDGPGGEGAPTATQLRAFTPDYAAPEQVLGQPTSTATDVYQLGLLLYELLCGRRAQQATGASPHALEQAVCVTEPPPPSARAGDDRAAADAIAAARSTTPAGLRRALRGDLDNIVLKALRKTPERRYASVAAMIEDLDRWRDGRTVRARPETWAYRSGKFLRRHAWATAAVVAVFASTVAYAVVATRQAEALARERDRAQAEAAKARQSLALIRRLFEGASPDSGGGRELTARQLLDDGWPWIERELDGQPALQAEMYDTVGGIYRKLGDFDRAQTLADRALAAARAGADPRGLARALRGRGRVAFDRGDDALAATLLDEALVRFRAVDGEDAIEVATTLQDLGRLHDRRRESEAAQAAFRDALAIRRKRLGEDDPAIAETLQGLGMSLRRDGDYAGAEPLLAQALSLRRQRLPARHPDIAYTLVDLAQVRNDLGDYASAEALYREALATMEDTLGPDHPNVALTLVTLSRVLKTHRDYDDARGLLQRALAIRRKVYGERHPNVAITLNDLGRLELEAGRLAAAEAHFRRALALYPADHAWRETTVFNLGELAERRGDDAEAAARYRESLATLRARRGDDHDRIGMRLGRLGGVLYRQGRFDEAERTLREALAIYRQRLPAGHERLANLLLPLGRLLADRDRDAEALPLLREAWQVRHDAFGDADPRTVEAVQALARVREPRA